MIRYMILSVIAPCVCLAQSQLLIKPHVLEGSPPWLVCYDEASQRELDDGQKSGIDCLVRLENTEAELLALRQEKDAVIHFTAVEYVKPKFFDEPIVRMIVIGFFSVGIGLGIGLSL